MTLHSIVVIKVIKLSEIQFWREYKNKQKITIKYKTYEKSINKIGFSILWKTPFDIDCVGV